MELGGGINELIKIVIIWYIDKNKIYYFFIFDVFEKLYIVLIVI